MSKLVAVSELKLGDVFEFLALRPDDSRAADEAARSTCVVIRPPAVNTAANTCFFRYRRDEAHALAPSHSESTHSFNGPPDLKVRVPGGPDDASEPAPAAAAKAEPSRAAEPAPEPKPVRKRAPQATSRPKAPPPKPVPLPPLPERLEGTERRAILPTLTKANESSDSEIDEAPEDDPIAETAAMKAAAKKTPAKKGTLKKGASKSAGSKGAGSKGAGSKGAGSKPTKKTAAAKKKAAAPKKGAAKMRKK